MAIYSNDKIIEIVNISKYADLMLILYLNMWVFFFSCNYKKLCKTIIYIYFFFSDKFVGK